MSKPKRTFLITAGPTIEDIDPVRFISNRATGRLGIETACAAFASGHRVKLIHGPVSEALLKACPHAGPRRRDWVRIPVRSAAEMEAAVREALADVDVVIMTAAVADWTPASFSPTKLKKSQSPAVLSLKPTVDILAALGRHKRQRHPALRLMGFALETGSGTTAQRLRTRLAEARRKLVAKNLDAIVLDSPAEMGAERGVFRVIRRGCKRASLLRLTKKQMAKHLIKLAESL